MATVFSINLHAEALGEDNSPKQMAVAESEQAGKVWAAFAAKRMAPTRQAVRFFVADSTVYRSYMGNDAALATIAKAIKEYSNPDAKKSYKVVISGFTSPEGSVSYNSQLAKMRQQSLRNYLVSEGISRDLPVVIANGGEDWESVRAYVEQSDIAE